MNYTISVVIPCFNDANYIQQAIDSVFSQTYHCHEIIVVDDGSNEETKSVLKRISNITTLITQENKGQSSARNKGISVAKGTFILVLDSDDYFESTFCELAIDAFKNLENTKIVTCYANLIFNNKSSQVYKPPGGSVKNFLVNNAALGSAMFKKIDWNNCGGYDETMNKGFEDWEFYINMLKNGGQAEVIPQTLYNYRKRENTTTSKANRIKYKLIKYIYAKHEEVVEKRSKFLIIKLLEKLENEEKEKIKNTMRIEFKIGELILKPFRRVKYFFK